MTAEPQSDALFRALAEQLKLPLLQIARLSELANTDQLPDIQAISNQALRLVDAYVQSRSQIELPLEPLMTSSVLYDVAHELEPLARQAGCDLTIDMRGKSSPVMAHRHTLETMLTLLGTSLLQAVHGDQKTRPYIILGTHRSAQGTIVGAFSSSVEITQRTLQSIRSLHGRAAQIAPVLGTSGGAELAIADELSNRLGAPLKSYRHDSLMGIGSLFLPSKQLQLV